MPSTLELTFTFLALFASFTFVGALVAMAFL